MILKPNKQWLASPACTELETIVIDWAANLFGLDHGFTNASGIGGGAIQVSTREVIEG